MKAIINQAMLTKKPSIIRTSRSGFTLVEILIVILVISILAILAIVGINPSKQRGKIYDVKRKHDLSQLRGIYDLYYTKQSHYPTGADVCYDEPQTISEGTCQCHICGFERDIGTFRDILNVLYCDPEQPQKSYLYQYDCSSQPGWFKLYATLSEDDADGNACSYGVTNKPLEFLEPYPSTCSVDDDSGGGAVGGGGGGGPAPSLPACPADPAPKYCRLGRICNICGNLSNCLLPSSCDTPTFLYTDSLCINQCQ